MTAMCYSTLRMKGHLSLRRRARERAQGTVWFALVVMVLVLTIGVLADGGLMFATYRRAALFRS